MVLHKEMFWGEAAGKRRFELTWKLKHKKRLEGCYLIALADADSSNLLDLIPADELRHLQKRLSEAVIVGMAADKAEAIEVARVIVDTVYRETKDVDIKAFFRG